MTRLEQGLFTVQADAVRKQFALRWKEFATHVAISENKVARDRYIKVGGNAIFSGGLQRFGRAAAVKSIHKALEPGVLLLKEAVEQEGIIITDVRWGVIMTFAAHAGYGSVAMRKTKKGYVIGGGDDVTEPNWDIDNQWIWQKMFKDACVEHGLLDTDTIKRIASDAKEHEFCPTFKDRALTFVFRPE